MNRFVQRMLGHYLMDAAEEGEDLPGIEEASTEAEKEEESPEEGGEQEGEGDEEVVVTIGDEKPDEEEEARAASPAMREMRRRIKEQNKVIKELEAKAAQAKPKEEAPAVGPKPTLEGCDYDADEFEKQYDGWLARKQKAELAERDKQRDVEEKQKAWQVKIEAYNGAKEKLRVKDYQDAEEAALGSLDENQQIVIVSYAKDPALLVYAVGKNPKEMARLAAIKDPIEFAIEMRELENKMKVEKRKPATKPEGTVSGTAPKSGAVDNQLERLRAEAEKSGDYSKVTAYKRQLKDKQRA